jgi:hypothetical protein
MATYNASTRPTNIWEMLKGKAGTTPLAYVGPRPGVNMAAPQSSATAGAIDPGRLRPQPAQIQAPTSPLANPIDPLRLRGRMPFGTSLAQLYGRS